MQHKFKVILAVLGFSQLFACGKNNQLDAWLDNDKKLSDQDSASVSQWLLDNDFNAEDFTVVEPPKGHSGEFSVLISAQHIQSIRAKNVTSLARLSQLAALESLDLNNFNQNDLSACPPQIKSLRLSGKALASLNGIQNCQQLEKIKTVHSTVKSLDPLLLLPKLTSININYSQLIAVEVNHSLPVLKFLDLSHNQINQFVIQADLPQLEVMILDDNQLTSWEHNQHTPLLQTLSVSNNRLQDLATVAPINSVNRISLSGNPLHDLTALTDWPHLKSIDFKGKLADSSTPINRKITQTNGPLEKQIAEAEYLKQKYLANSEFIESLPQKTGGQAHGVGKNISSHFDLHKNPMVSGSIKIDTLNGLMRLPVVSTDDLLQYHRKIVIRGTATVKQGSFNIYSPTEQDFWDMAKLFVDTPIKQRPKDRDDLVIKGFTVDRVSPGEAVEFQANLVAIAGKYFLLLGPEQREAKGIHLEFE